MNRRHFLHASAATLASTAASTAAPAKAGALSGIQIAPFSLLDEGIEACLDFLQETARINALFLYSQDYHIGEYHFNVLAKDHPKPPRDPRGRELPRLWVRLPKEPFKGLPLQHPDPDPSLEYGNRDLFKELVEPCRERGIKLYPRILEAGMRRAKHIPGYESVATVDLDGNPGGGPCWNHPAYRDWVRITIEQIMRRYDVDGLQYGAERTGQLSDVLFRGDKVECFCEHCVKRNRERGIDAEAAKEGYRELETVMKRVGDGSLPADGIFARVMRVFMRRPEVLAWNQSWFESDDEIQKMVCQTAKAERPDADVGQHVDHQRSSWDLFYRASISYADMAGHNDFIKPILYHDIMGVRLKEWVIERMRSLVLAEFSNDQALELFYTVFGLDPAAEPSFDRLDPDGMSPDYVRRETTRCVDAVDGKAKVYPGIGIDVPHYVPGGKEVRISPPEKLTESVRLALAAGADGVIASREYDEMTRPSLEAFGAGLG